MGDGDGDVGFVGHVVGGVKVVNGHLAHALILELFFDGLARSFLFRATGTDNGEQKGEEYKKAGGWFPGSVTVHRLNFYLSSGAFSSNGRLMNSRPSVRSVKVAIFIKQLLAGRDFGEADHYAAQMANFVYVIGSEDFLFLSLITFMILIVH